MKKEFVKDDFLKSRINFKNLSEFKKKQYLLCLGREIEKNWGNEKEQKILLDHFSNMYSCFKGFVFVNQYFRTLEDFFIFFVPLERELGENWIEVEEIDRICGPDKIRETSDVIVIAHNMRSLYNIGQFFRTCECFSVKKLYLTGYTTNPEKDSRIKKTSLGTQDFLSWSHVQLIDNLLCELKEEEYTFCALETAKNAKNIYETKLPQKSAFIFGNERYGLDQEVLKKSDIILKIPITGQKNSLNVALSMGITLGEHMRQYKSY